MPSIFIHVPPVQQLPLEESAEFVKSLRLGLHSGGWDGNPSKGGSPFDPPCLPQE